LAWVDGGAAEGKSADAPKLAQFVDGWGIHRPDVVFEMPNAFEVPASGTIASPRKSMNSALVCRGAVLPATFPVLTSRAAYSESVPCR